MTAAKNNFSKYPFRLPTPHLHQLNAETLFLYEGLRLMMTLLFSMSVGGWSSHQDSLANSVVVNESLLLKMSSLSCISVFQTLLSSWVDFFRSSDALTASGHQTLLLLLEACRLSPDPKTATSVHACIIKNGYRMYSSLSSLLLSIYMACQCHTFASRLQKEIFSSSVDIISANSHISSFMKIGEVNVAKKLFQILPIRDAVTWNSLIGGYMKNGYFQEALTTFKDMLKASIEPDGFTFASVTAACARIGALHHAKWVHGLLIEKNIEVNSILSAALVDMYAKCGKIDMAKEIFSTVRRNDISIWNAMVNGLAIHGLAADAISTFSMMKVEHISPDSVTFIGILTACSHCGLVEEGRNYFDLMKANYSIEPELEHYGTMVDLFGRSGLLDEAYSLVKEMRVEPDIVIWRALLGACKIHNNSELGELAMGKITNLSSGDYTSLSNIYCSVKKWTVAAEVRLTMQKERVHKNRGKSWVEFGDSIYSFNAGDKSHPDAEMIYKLLGRLLQRAKMEGFVTNTDLVLMDVSEEEKEENLGNHSEKLALAFGILKSSPGTEIKIFKNLRICADCHSWMKMVSNLLNRVIIVRDRIRFHRFEGGSCSCGDYW